MSALSCRGGWQCHYICTQTTWCIESTITFETYLFQVIQVGGSVNTQPTRCIESEIILKGITLEAYCTDIKFMRKSTGRP